MPPRDSGLMSEIDNLSRYLLISLDNQGCRFRSNSLIWITKHGNSGSLGLVVNKPPHQKMSSSLRIKNDILTTGVKIRDFEPINRGELLLLHTRDLKETNSLKIEEGDSLSGYSSSFVPRNSSFHPIRGDIWVPEWIPGQSQSEIIANIWLIAPFDRKIVRYV